MHTSLILPIDTPGLIGLLADIDCMCLWECLRKARRATAGKLAKIVARPRARVQDDLERMAAVGLVRRRHEMSSSGDGTWAVVGEPIVVTVPDAEMAMHRPTIDRIRTRHQRYFEEVVLRHETANGKARGLPRLSQHRLASVRTEDLLEFRRRLNALFEFLEIVNSRRRAPKDNNHACNMAVSVEVRPIDGAVLPLPTRIRLHDSETPMQVDDAATKRGAASDLTPGGAPRKRTLSRREQQVAEALAGGLTRKELAQALGLSTNTIGTLLKRVYTKLGVHRRAELATVMANNHRA
jgi:DNA-binding CsgD family transcriptional regulator